MDALRNIIAIDHGTVTKCSEIEKIGTKRFFITWLDEDGFAVQLDDTPDYVTAWFIARAALDGFDASRIVEVFRQKGGAS